MGSIPHLSILKGPNRNLKSNYIHKLFEDVANSSPNKTALIYETCGNIRKHTYGELNDITNKIARFIKHTVKSQSIPRNPDGDYIVAVCMTPSDELVQILLAIWKAGAAYLPLDPTFPAARIEHILKESKPVMIIYEEDNDSFGDIVRFSTDTICIQKNSFSGENLSINETLKHVKDDLAIVLYTSGSTGVPKGVRLPHKVILNRLQWQFKTFPYSDTESVGIFKTALTFVDSVSEIWGPLINGLTILVVGKATTTDPEKLVSVLEHYKIERLVLVPTLLRSLLMFLQLQNNKNLLCNLKIWVCSGETLTVSLSEEFFKYFPENEHKLCNFYGSTEIMGDVSYHIISSPNQLINESKVPIGIPVDNTILYLLDKDCRPVKIGAVGELFVSGLNLAAGYVNGRDPEKFIDNPLTIDPTYSKLFRTGDFALLEKGALLFEGRTDSQVKIRGHRVDLTEVEKGVSSVHGVDKCVVLCYKPGEINQALLAFVTTNESISETQIESMVAAKLTSYMVPQVILLDSIPLLVNGKVDRQALLRIFASGEGADLDNIIDYKGVSQKQMDAAKVLFEIIASVLNRTARLVINVKANFYVIGGNSLNSIFTITNLAENGYQISIGDFIGAKNLGEVLDKMLPVDANLKLNSETPLYRSELLRDEFKPRVVDMITTSFYLKADLEQWLMPDISEPDYTELVDKLWEPLIEKALSFVVISEKSGDVVAVGLNFDAHDEPDVQITSKLVIIFEFLESIEGPIRDTKLPLGKGSVLHSFMMATHSSLSSKENVGVMKFMEDEVLKVAKSRKFVGILTTNTSPLTQQLGESIYGYKSILDYQVNQYIAPSGLKPFEKAPDEQRAIVHWKEL